MLFDDSDEVLVARWRRGEQPAGKELYRRYFPVVRRYFFNKAGEREFGDLVGETFVRCQRGLQTFRGDASFRTFILRIARNVFVDHCRKQSNERKHLPRAPSPGDSSGELSVREIARSPFSIIAERQQDRLLLEALRSLPIESQELLELRYWEGLSGPDIAAVCEIPEGTVRSRLATATQRLKACMESLASSPDVLASTVSDLDGWARKIRDNMGRERQ